MTVKGTIRASILLLLLSIFIACTGTVRNDQSFSPSPRDPSFYKWTSIEIVELLREHDLEVEGVMAGFIIGVHKMSENTIFMIPSYGSDVGAVVSSFETRESRQEYVEHYHGLNHESPLPVWWIYSHENIVLLISGKVPEEAAKVYEEILKSVD